LSHNDDVLILLSPSTSSGQGQQLIGTNFVRFTDSAQCNCNLHTSLWQTRPPRLPTLPFAAPLLSPSALEKRVEADVSLTEAPRSINLKNLVAIGTAAVGVTAIALDPSLQDALVHFPHAALDWYTGYLDQAPIVTKACTSAVVYTVGDVLAQRQESEDDDLDGARVLRSTVAALIGHGPLSHVWYETCDYLFDSILHWQAAWSVIPKVLVDQTLWGPFWNNTYILLLGLMCRESPERIWQDMKTTTVPLVVKGLKLWPAAHLVTYGLVPTNLRLLWVDTVEIVWVMILANQAAQARKDRDMA